MSIEFQTGFQQSDPGRTPQWSFAFIPQGWQCPACRVIYAPHVQACYCQNLPPSSTVTVNWPQPHYTPNTAGQA